MRNHYYRLKRGYQFPNAVATIQDGFMFGWVVNLTHTKPLYGVVRYSPHGDNVAWIESDTHFDNDKEAAIKWVQEIMKQLKLEG